MTEEYIMVRRSLLRRGSRVYSREERNTLKLLSNILLDGVALNMGMSQKATMLANSVIINPPYPGIIYTNVGAYTP